jgi:hypothetical protein
MKAVATRVSKSEPPPPVLYGFVGIDEEKFQLANQFP